MMKNEELFSGKAGSYVSARPGYPQALMTYLKEEMGVREGTAVADIGSGTGIFSRQLLALGADVYAVEPNDDMRSRAEEEWKKAGRKGSGACHSIRGTADHTTLPDHSMDLVTAAQAFHWFEPAAFAAECRRILKKEGPVLLVWNLRVETAPVTADCSRVFRAYCPRFKGYNTGMKADDIRISDFFGGRYRRLEFDHPLVYDRAHFLLRYLSSSYSLREGEEGYEACLSKVADVFDRYEQGGVVTVPNRTYAYTGSPLI